MAVEPLDHYVMRKMEWEIGSFGGKDIADALLMDVLGRGYDAMNPLHRRTFLTTLGIRAVDNPGLDVIQLLEGSGVDPDDMAKEYRRVYLNGS